MKAFLLSLFFATQWAYAKPFVPMTEAQEGELRHVLSVIQAAAVEQGAKLESAEAKASDAVLQLGAATEALVLAGQETQRVQDTLDTRTRERDEARADAAVQRKWKWRYLGAALAEGFAIVVLLYLLLKP